MTVKLFQNGYQKHKINLTNILIDIYKDNLLSSCLGFKGGTSAMLFHNLLRFSVDLDFDYLGDKNKINEVIKRMTSLLSKNIQLKTKVANIILVLLISYEKGEHNIKIEISTRDNTYNHYNIKSLWSQYQSS